MANAPVTGLHDGLDLDVAIVGGGVGGLYSGYRLCTGDYATGGRPQAVHIFESGTRIAGRLYSVVLPGMDVTGELGGMRYMTSQGIATALIEKVFADQLEHVDFPMGDPADHLFYLRRQRFPANSWTLGQASGNPFQTRYALDDDDVGFSAYQLFNKVVYDVLMADPAIAKRFGAKMTHPTTWDYEFTLTSQDWDAIKPVARYCFPGPFEGCLVNDLGFWNLLEDQCGQDGYQFLADAGGYYSNTINWNAGEAFENMVGDFTGPDVSYRTIQGGYDKVAYALADAFLAAPGTAIWIENRLTRVDRTPPGSGGRRYQLTIFNEPSGQTWRVFADSVILALPRRSLELLDQSCFLFSPDGGGLRTPLADAVPSVILQPSMKILMGFTEPWWVPDLHTLSGESVTDLPMRQCYYFGTDPANQHSLFLSSYNDMDTVSFWSTLQQGELFEPQPTRLVSAADLDPHRGLQAPRIMIAAAMAQVRELHGPQTEPIPDPYIAYCKDWAEDPFGGGYHAWAAGVSVKDTMPFMRQPIPGEAIHVTGESYSDLQGWIEGALCVSEHVMRDHYDVLPPAWLPSDYYLGW
jgi:monoamine oxidase